MYRHGPKRLLDIAVSATALLVLGLPMLIVALLVRITDPGPAIFRQGRVGAAGRIFNFYKFRSMPVNTGDIPSDRLGEVRIGGFARLLRRTNADEFPQLWNVLKGDMSLVGPRPPIPAQIDLIELRRANGALACRPGLTGLAQVNSFDGMSVAEKAAHDGAYAESVSFGKDLAIILRTFAYLRRPPPTY